MELSLIQIGNSKGIRLPKTLIEKYNLRDTVEIILEKGHIIIKPSLNPRKGWDKAFKQMADHEEDQLLFDDAFEDENLDEWN